MLLYWGSGSAPCWKAILVMMEKGLWKDGSHKLLSFSEKEHKSEDILKLNPRGQVPTFQDGDIVICESTAICMYLEENYRTPRNRLIPADPKLASQVLQRVHEQANFSRNIIQTYLYHLLTTEPDNVDHEKLKEMAPTMDKELRIWDSYLEGKSYLVGEKFTMADVFLYPDLAMLERQGLPFEKLGLHNLKKYYKMLQTRPSIQGSKPPHWEGSRSKHVLENFEQPKVRQSAN